MATTSGLMGHMFSVNAWCTLLPAPSGIVSVHDPIPEDWDSEIELVSPFDADLDRRTPDFLSFRRPLVGRKGS
jgi:hypothetical protein